MEKSFRAPRWLSSGHVQTLGAALPFFSTVTDLVEERLWFEVEGGAVHGRAWWHEPEGKDERRPTALVLHGVAGTSEAKSVVRGGRALYRAGFHVVRLDLRGAGAGVERAPTIYHAGLTEDVRAAVLALSEHPRVASVVIVAISLGGHVALKLAGEWGESAPEGLRAIVTISSPVDLGAATVEIDKLRNMPYCAYVLRGLISQVQAFGRIHPEKVKYDPERLRTIRKIRDYHTHVIAPMHGFESADDYHAKATAAPYLSRVAIPTRMIHAEDDPMVPLGTVTPFLKDASRAIEVLTSPGGGHVGWLGGLRERHWVHTWAIERAIEFIRARAE
jgi:predicted alpha/beta-fold hydrolase